MLVTLDLTTRQTTRVLEQAVQNKAKLEVDPRPEFLETPLWCAIERREQDLLVVNVLDVDDDTSFVRLIGAMCDVRTILSEQLYLFSTVIVDALENTAPKRLSLAIPEAIQVANRRRFTRKSPTEPVPVRLTIPGVPQPAVGSLGNISRNGLGCRVSRKELDDALFIGDQAQLEFVLPWINQIYALTAEICTKNTCHDADQMLVGFEFIANDAASRATLELLRVALDNETERLIETDGDRL